MEFIKSIPKPVGVVAVAGTYRTGKSYLMNKMFPSKRSASTQSDFEGITLRRITT